MGWYLRWISQFVLLWFVLEAAYAGLSLVLFSRLAFSESIFIQLGLHALFLNAIIEVVDP